MKLTLQNLSFAYPQQVPLLKNITAELAPGRFTTWPVRMVPAKARC